MDKQFLSRFLKGSASTSVATLATIHFHFVSIMILARHMPKEAFGIYSLVIVVSHGMQILGGLGLNLTLVKFISGEQEGGDREVFTAIFLMRVGLLLLVSALVYGLGEWLLPLLFKADIGPYIIFVPAIFVLASLRDLLFHYLQGRQRFGPYAVVQVASAAVRLASIVAFLYLDVLVIDFLLYIEIITYGLSLLFLVAYVPFRRLMTFPVGMPAIRKILGFGSPLYINDMLTYIYNRTSVLLIGGLLSSASVAMYEVASKVPEGVGRLFNSLIVVYFPSMSELLHGGRREEAEQFMNKALALVSVGLTFVAFVSFLFGEEIVILLFSEQYRDASFVFALLMMNLSLNTLSRLMGYTIVAAGHSSVPVRVNLVSSALNVGGCLLLIPPFGVLGAVYALLAMNTASQILNHWYLSKAEIRATLTVYLRPILLLAAMVGGYLALGVTHIGLRIALSVAYPVLCWLVMPELRGAMRFIGGHARKAKGNVMRSVRGAGSAG